MLLVLAALPDLMRQTCCLAYASEVVIASFVGRSVGQAADAHLKGAPFVEPCLVLAEITGEGQGIGR